MKNVKRQYAALLALGVCLFLMPTLTAASETQAALYDIKEYCVTNFPDKNTQERIICDDTERAAQRIVTEAKAPQEVLEECTKTALSLKQGYLFVAECIIKKEAIK